MPQSPTARLDLYRPLADGTEDVNVVLDLLNNWDKLDAKVGALACTSGTRPASPYNGQFIRETDTLKMYCCTNTAGPVWTQVLFGTADFDNPITISSGNYNATLGGYFSIRAAALDDAFGSRVTGDTFDRYVIDADGKMNWGSGALARDVNLYRSSANVLTTDDSLGVGIDLAVTGDAVIGGSVTADQLATGSAVLRSVLSAVTTLANTTTETALATLNIPASDAVVGAVYRIKAWGTCAVTGTPTMTFRVRLGGAAGTQMNAFNPITCRSAMADGDWDAECYIAVVTTGGSGTWNPTFRVGHNFLTSGTTFTTLGPDVVASVTKDTTISNDLVITGTWSAASPSNSIVCRGFSAQRVA